MTTIELIDYVQEKECKESTINKYIIIFKFVMLIKKI